MKKILTTTAVATALLFGAMSANAQPVDEKGMKVPPKYHHQNFQKEFTPEMKAKMEKRKAEIDKRLKITEEQKVQLKEIHEQSKAEIAPKIKQLSEAEFELEVLMKRKFNEEHFGIATLEEVQLSGKSIDELKNEIHQLKKEIKEIKKANFEKSQAIFTDEQKKELEKMKKERIKKMKKHHKKFHKKPCPNCLEQKAYPLEKRAK